MSAAVKEQLVSVIVPAYNGVRTIERTLRSISAQTYSNLEIIVVDDGSVDETASIVRNYSALDVRVRLVQQENLGVAAARNAGLRDCHGQFVAFIDADDLWHPTRIAKHMQLITARGEELGVVYSPCRCIDESDNVIETMGSYGCEGWVFLQLIYCNFVANGSGLLLRKAAVESVGGYDTRLREYGLEGCEDYLLQLTLAQRYQFGFVPEYLIGYRVRGPRMSIHAARMAKSNAYVLHCIRQGYSGVPAAPFELLTLRNNPLRAAKLLRAPRLLVKHRSFCALLFASRIKMKLRSIFQVRSDDSPSPEHLKSFLEYDPQEGPATPVLPHDFCAFTYLARLEANFIHCKTAERSSPPTAGNS